jgi:hypothetical protein
MVQAERACVVNARHTAAMGDYYAGRLQTQTDIAAGHDQARVVAAQVHADAVANKQQTGQAGQASLSRTADKEASTLYGADAMPGVSDQTRGQMATTYHDLRMNGTTGPQAEYIAKGVSNNTLALRPTPSGHYEVVDPKTKQVISYLSPAVGARLAGGALPTKGAAPTPGGPIGSQPASPSPVGAGASSPYAAGAGVGQDLTGTTQPQQGVPTQQPQQ